jgi:hypothetical protein
LVNYVCLGHNGWILRVWIFSGRQI